MTKIKSVTYLFFLISLSGFSQEQNQWPEVDGYLRAVNEIFGRAGERPQSPGYVLDSAHLQSLSKAERSWLSYRIARQAPRALQFIRQDHEVLVVDRALHLTLARLKLERKDREIYVRWNNAEFKLSDYLNDSSLPERTRKLSRLVAAHAPSTPLTPVETALKFILFPLTLLTGCSTFDEGSEGATALAGGHVLTHGIYDRNQSAPRDINESFLAAPRPLQVGHKCTDGKCYESYTGKPFNKPMDDNATDRKNRYFLRQYDNVSINN